MYKQNLIEKIVQRYAVGYTSKVRSGDYLTIKPHVVMTHDNTAAVMTKFKSIGASKIKDPRQVVFTLDHDIQNKSPKNLQKYSDIQSFGFKNKVDFYPAGRGIGHQVMVEEGYAFPYTMAVASDSHSNMYGGIGSLGTPVVRTDAAAIWATGMTWWQVPSVVKVEFKGKLQPGMTGKDIIIALCGLINKDQVLNACIEFSGEGVESLSVDDRLTIANMTTEWGALAGVFPVDGKTIKWLRHQALKLSKQFETKGSFRNNDTVFSLKEKTKHPRYNKEAIDDLETNLLVADEGATYDKHIILDISTILDPQVAGPNSVKVSNSLSVLAEKNIAIQKAYLLSCTNSRASDIKQAADVFIKHKEKNGTVQVHPGVEFYIAPASSNVHEEVIKDGSWGTLLDAGAIALPPGCGPCIGLGVGLLKDGEVGISATNRNFKGRMGSRNAEAYLSSPAVVASSAISGRISGPSYLSNSSRPKFNITVNDKPKTIASNSKSVAGFKSIIQGEIIFCPVNNLNTDGIYAGKYTYREDITPAEMARVTMENYDPKFSSIVKKGDILLSGYNFGSGSSREQAATSLKYAGISLILSASFSETFKRNSLNNALICLESPELFNDVDHWVGKNRSLSNRLPLSVEVRMNDGILVLLNGPSEFFKKEYYFSPVGHIAQELVLEGGLENWIQKKL